MAKILCVEDEPDIREIIAEELADFGHRVETADNGETGLSTALTFRPDIILSDFLMPTMTGPEMIKALRDGYPEFSATPCIVVSAYADEKHRKEADLAGANLYLTKPIDFEGLASLLKDLLCGGGKT